MTIFPIGGVFLGTVLVAEFFCTAIVAGSVLLCHWTSSPDAIP